jgi:hypothetical protein
MVLQYWINPTGSGSSLTDQQIIDAINAAAQTWMAADPQVQLVYGGTTTQQPLLNNVVGFDGQPSSARLSKPDQNGHYTAFDMNLLIGNAWTWRPCDPAAGNPCSDYGTGGGDLQNIVTHEWGHVLGLGHPTNVNNSDTELTMYGGYPQSCGGSQDGCRAQDTLGLGDVLGERYLYPTSAPVPTLYSP